MILDSSAVIAILLEEPESGAFSVTIDRDPRRLISVVSAFECNIFLETRGGADAVDDLDLFLLRIGAQIQACGIDDLAIARRAFRLYGKGRHRAGLNFGDCFSYALARRSGQPLLFKGDDFVHTDIEPAFQTEP